jgi:hypothetical protein
VHSLARRLGLKVLGHGVDTRGVEAPHRPYRSAVAAKTARAATCRSGPRLTILRQRSARLRTSADCAQRSRFGHNPMGRCRVT